MKKVSERWLKDLGKPGVLIRLDGTAEVFYITEEELEAFRLPEGFQLGGKGDPQLFNHSTDEKPLTGENLQRELNKPGLFGETNLLNAFFCEKGPFVQLEGEDKRVELVIEAGKGNKPLTRFPSF